MLNMATSGCTADIEAIVQFTPDVCKGVGCHGCHCCANPMSQLYQRFWKGRHVNFIFDTCISPAEEVTHGKI